MKSVIFNADDFGASERVNRAILRSHTEGVLTSTSLMVNEPAAGNAVEMARAAPSLAVGLHLVLSNGSAARPASAISNLVDSSGRFAQSPAVGGIRYFFSKAARRQIPFEIAEQFSRFAATGLPWSHVDGHQHLHLHPVIWDAMISQCEAHGVRRARIPNEELVLFSRGRTIAHSVEWAFFRMLRRRCLRTLAGRGFTLPDRVYGHLETGRMSEEYVVELLGRLAGQTNEIYFHPGASIPGEDFELQTLLSPRIADRLYALDIRSATYADIESDSTERPEAVRGV